MPPSVDRFLEMAELAGRVRKDLDADPRVDARNVLVAVRESSIVLTGFVRNEEDGRAIRRLAEGAGAAPIVDELAVAVGRAPRVDLPDAELLLPSPEAGRNRPETAKQ